MELTEEAIRQLGEYEGWVAWVDGGQTPLFEAVPWQPGLASLMEAGVSGEQQFRAKDRSTVEWDELPHDQVTRVELYWARDVYPQQPVVRVDRMHDQELRWVQMKMRGMQVRAEAVAPGEKEQDAAVQRTPLLGYRIGYYAPDRLDMPDGVGWRHAPLLFYEVTRDGVERKAYDVHPCWPRPHGLGWNPSVLGLSRGEVPPHPGQETEAGKVVRPPPRARNRDDSGGG